MTNRPDTVEAVSRVDRPSEGGLLPALVAAAIRGDERAWSELVERFAPLVSTVARRFRLTTADADDVRQNVWLLLVEHLADLREPRALPGWIVTTTRREAMRIVSRDRSVEPVDPQADHRLDVVDRRDVATDLLRRERVQAVRDGLAQLQSRQRDLLLLTFAEPNVPYRQISRRLGIPAGSSGRPVPARCTSSGTPTRCAPWRADPPLAGRVRGQWSARPSGPSR